MTIGEHIKLTDINTYKKLLGMFKTDLNKSRTVELGDSVTNLMKHDSYKREGRRIKQRGWG